MPRSLVNFWALMEGSSPVWLLPILTVWPAIQYLRLIEPRVLDRVMKFARLQVMGIVGLYLSQDVAAAASFVVSGKRSRAWVAIYMRLTSCKGIYNFSKRGSYQRVVKRVLSTHPLPYCNHVTYTRLPAARFISSECDKKTTNGPNQT